MNGGCSRVVDEIRFPRGFCVFCTGVWDTNAMGNGDYENALGIDEEAMLISGGCLYHWVAFLRFPILHRNHPVLILVRHLG